MIELFWRRWANFSRQESDPLADCNVTRYHYLAVLSDVEKLVGRRRLPTRYDKSRQTVRLMQFEWLHHRHGIW